MTLVGTPLESVDYVVGSGIATNAGASEATVLSTDVIQVNVQATPNVQQPPTTVRPVIIECNMNVTPGTTTSAVVVKCRQGIGTGGTQVGASETHTLAAGSTAQLHFKFRDTSGVADTVAGTAYTITLTQTAGTAAGTVNTVDIEVKC
jgi:hypothetical protein